MSVPGQVEEIWARYLCPEASGTRIMEDGKSEQ